MIRRLLSVVLCLWVSSAFAQDFPEDSDFYVNDYANLLTDAHEEDLRVILDDLYIERGIEFTVLTISRLSDFGHTGSIEVFATDLFNTWGIGDAERNDGLLLLVSHGDREMRIEVGAGYGTTLDSRMQGVIDKSIVPYFRRDNYDKGITVGVDEVIYQVTGRYPGLYSTWDLSQKILHAFGLITKFFTSVFGWMLVGGIVAVPLGSRLYWRWHRTHVRKCPRDGTRMRLYIEEMEDEKLTQGQQMEEQMKSIEHDVWYCDTCDFIEVESFSTGLNRNGACGNCNYRTLVVNVEVHKKPSMTTDGLRKIIGICKTCNNEDVRTAPIPSLAVPAADIPSYRYSERSLKRPRVYRSVSSGKRSRGGGRSSGGGASGRW